MGREQGTATVVKTEAGWVGLARTDVGLRRSTLPQRTKAEAREQLGEGWRVVGEAEDALLARAAAFVRERLAGQAAALDLALDLDGVPEFTKSVLASCHGIPDGSTCSYADLARAVGNPKAARAVGQAMRQNPLPLIIPCHRVVGSDGSLVGFAGGQEALHKKAALLRREGVLP